MQQPNNMTTLEQVAKLLEPHAATFEQHCYKHPANEATMLCTVCGCGMCTQCIGESSASKLAIICESCSTATRNRQALNSVVKLLKLPAAWVILCVIISGIAYSCNLSNPSLTRMGEIEANRPWFQKQVGKLLLDKASRENQRAAALRYLKKSAQAAVWSKRAAVSFAKTAEYWQTTPVYNALKIGEARSLLAGGNPQRALKILKTIKVKNASITYPGYAYYLGQAYAKNGDPKRAWQCFQQAMSAAEIVQRRQQEYFVELMSGDRRAAKVICSVRMICGVNLSVNDLAEKLKPYGIKPKPDPRASKCDGFSKLLHKYTGQVKVKNEIPREKQVKPPPAEIAIEFNPPVQQKKKQGKDDFSIEFVN